MSAFSSLRVADYRRLLSAVLVSNASLMATDVAVAWIMLELTGSTFMVGLVAAAMWIPQLLLSLPSGVLADHFDRRRLLVVGLGLRATVSFGLAVVAVIGTLDPAVLLVATVLTGTGMAVCVPSYGAMLPDVVPRDLLPNAISLHSGMFNVARAIGPALGGLLVAFDRPDVVFAVDAVTYLVLIVVVARLRLPSRPRAAPLRLRRGISDGITELRGTPVLRLSVGLAASFALAAAGIRVLLPELADSTYGMGAAGYGILTSAFGVGAVIAAMTSEALRRRLGARTIPLGIALFGLAQLGVAAGRLPVVAVLALVIAGAGALWTMATLTTAVQLGVRDEVRARVLSVQQAAMTGAHPVGALAAGAVADVVSAAPTLALLGVANLAVSSFATRRRRDLVAVEQPVVADREPAVP